MDTINLKVPTENLDSYINEEEILLAYKESLNDF
jgi:hypothetical protein